MVVMQAMSQITTAANEADILNVIRFHCIQPAIITLRMTTMTDIEWLTIALFILAIIASAAKQQPRCNCHHDDE